MGIIEILRQKRANVLIKKIEKAKKRREENEQLKSLKQQLREARGSKPINFKSGIKKVGSGLKTAGKGALVLGEATSKYFNSYDKPKSKKKKKGYNLDDHFKGFV